MEWDDQSIVSSTSTAGFLILRNDVTLLAFVLALEAFAGRSRSGHIEEGKERHAKHRTSAFSNVIHLFHQFSLCRSPTHVLHVRVLSVPS